MKIALYGATGNIGQRILNELLSRGHSVTAIVREPSKMTQSSPNLAVVKGDIMNASEVGSQVKNHDIVVSSYGPGFVNCSPLLDATRSLISGMKQSGVPRILSVGGAGSLTAPDGELMVSKFPPEYLPIATAHLDALNIYRQENELNWTVLCPPAMIVPGQRTGTFRTGGTACLFNEKGESSISMEDYAIAIADEVESAKHKRENYTVAY